MATLTDPNTLPPISPETETKWRIGTLGDAIHHIGTELFEIVRGPALDPGESFSPEDLRRLYVMTATLAELGSSIEQATEGL